MSILLLLIRLLIVASLYAFIGWIVYTLWIEVYRKQDNRSKQTVPTITIKYSDDNGEKYLYINHPVAIIGREQDCDVFIANRSVSSRHSRLSYHQNQWWIEDLNSTNGTFLNQDLLKQPAVLMSDDQITVGNIELSIQIEKIL